MTTERMEAFSDGVIAIIITIMVLELKMPHGGELGALREVLPAFVAYAMSFVYLGIYWVNHHHMIRATEHVNGKVLWANLHLLFWLSIVPATTAWMGDHPTDTVPTAVYAASLLMPAIAYYILQSSIIKHEGPSSSLAEATGGNLKGKISPLLYLAAFGLAFVRPWMSDVLFIVVALIWLVPDPRIEARLAERGDAIAK